jgi:DNA-binding response OmpR family regulator
MPKRRKILLIEDDREILRGMHVRLRSAGYEVLTASDGRQGLASSRESHPDAIVLDIRMPEMDGLTALRQLRETPDTSRIPVVMLSASLVDQRKALDMGAKYFLGKPYDAQKLIAAVGLAIDQSTDSAGE